MKNACHFLWCVRTTIILLGCAGGEDFVSRPKSAQNVNAARLAFQSFSVTSPMCTGCWARNPVRCKEVVNLSYDNFSLTASISNTLKWHIKYFSPGRLSSVLKGLHGPKFYFTV